MNKDEDRGSHSSSLFEKCNFYVVPQACDQVRMLENETQGRPDMRLSAGYLISVLRKVSVLSGITTVCTISVVLTLPLLDNILPCHVK